MIIAINYLSCRRDDSVDHCLDTVYTRIEPEDRATRLRRIEREILMKEIAQGRVHPHPSHLGESR